MIIIDPSLLVVALAAIMLLGNLVLRVTGNKRAQFAFNCIMLIIILLRIGILLYMGTTTIILNTFSINPFSLLFSALFTLALLLINLIAFTYSENYGDFALISNFALLGMYVVSSSVSLITIFIGLELSTIPVVFIILLSKKGLEAATKFFIMAAVAIALLSFAIVLIYGSANAFALKSYAQTTLLTFAALLFIAALGFEASIFPFNVLIPDIYTGSSAYVTAMLGGANKTVGFAALLQVLILVFITSKTVFLFVAVLAVLTMFYGNIVALTQRNLKRMLAYSSISQAGYMLIGIAVSNQSGIAATIFMIFSHMFIFIGMLAIVALLESKNRNEIDDVIGLSGENNLAAFSLSLFMLALIGLPLTTGFVGKFLLFLSAVNANLVWLAIFGIINTAISVFYYARVIMAMYTKKESAHPMPFSTSTWIVVIVCVLVTIVFGVFPAPVIGLANNAAAFLLSSH